MTYWDYIGWKDPLGRVFSDGRQRGYSQHKKLGRVYTPQMVINGGKEFVGSRKHEANKNLSNAKPVKPITMAGVTPNGTQISLPQVNKGNYAVWVAGIDAEHKESIKRGENRGEMITYTNNVISFKQAGLWDGSAKTLNIRLDKKPNIDHFVIFAQKDGFGEIIAASKIDPLY